MAKQYEEDERWMALALEQAQLPPIRVKSPLARWLFTAKK
jgi:hypothetical protein